MAGRKSREGLRRIGEQVTGRLETWLSAWERSRLLLAYTQLRRRVSGAGVPGMPDTTDLDPYVVLSLGLHLLLALLIYFLAPRAIPLAERPPISVRILETKAQAPTPAPQQKKRRPAHKRKAKKVARQKPKPRQTPPKPKPAPPKPAAKPTFTPKMIPRVAMVKPEVPRPLSRTLPRETAPPPKSEAPSPELLLPQKGLLPMPVKPFQAESPREGGPSETPRSLAAPPPSLPPEAPAEVTPIPASPTVAPASPQPPVPRELTETALEGFQQPTGPVVVPERFRKGGRPQTTPGAAVALIDTSDPDFTEYFELIKRRVHAAWRYPKGVRGVQKVSLRFSLDRAGAAHGVKVVRSTNARLNQSAVEAMGRASPFPPIPEKFRALVGQPLTLIFTVTIQ
ncbi:MAG: TonB family protein [Candidatus Methylomirabilales bacterium]